MQIHFSQELKNGRKIGQRVDHGSRSGIPENHVVTGQTVGASGEADNRHPSRLASNDTVDTVLHDNSSGRVDVHRRGSVEE